VGLLRLVPAELERERGRERERVRERAACGSHRAAAYQGVKDTRLQRVELVITASRIRHHGGMRLAPSHGVGRCSRPGRGCRAVAGLGILTPLTLL
jgi:hypothetical protein